MVPCSGEHPLSALAGGPGARVIEGKTALDGWLQIPRAVGSSVGGV